MGRTYKGKPTIKEYKESIAGLEAELNERISSVDLEKVSDLFTKELSIIAKLKPTSRGEKIEYERYKMELEYALSWDIESADGQRQMKERERKAYETFKARFGEISYDEWRDMADTFGSAGQSVMEQFYRGGQGGNGDIVRVFKDAKEAGITKNIGSAMQKVLRASKRDDFPYRKTPTGLLDALRDEIGLNS